MMSMLNIVLLGKTSAGKSASGNTILRREEFSSKSIKNQTPGVKDGSVYIDGETLIVYDTPGLFDPETKNKDVIREWQILLDSVPSVSTVFLLVMKIDRFSSEEKRTVEVIEEFLGDQRLQNTWILFTRGDELETQGLTIKDFIEESKELEKIVQRFNNRYHVFNNIKHDPDQVRGLIEKIKANQMNQELRIVLLGKNISETSRVGNFILDRDAFNTEAPPPSVKQHSERAGGMVEGRYITIINTPHLFNPQLSEEELFVGLRECAALCSPGPHVFLLVLQSENFTKEDEERVIYVMKSFSPPSMDYAIVLFTDKSQLRHYLGVNLPENNKNLKQLITDCKRRFEKMKFDKAQILQLLKKIDTMVEDNRGHLTCQINEQFTMKFQEGKHLDLSKRDGNGAGGKKSREKGEKSKASQKMNLVLCGSNRVLKSSISDLILGQREFSAESRSVCVKREAEVCGRLMTLVELPALYSSQLSEEEVMRETLRCVSLCDPGVHAFLFILSVGLLTDEDKGELEKIQNIFSTRITDHLIVIFTTDLPVCNAVTEFIEHTTETKGLITACGNRYKVVETKEGNPKQVSELLEIADITVQTKAFCVGMYVKAQEERIQHELENKYKDSMNKMGKKMHELEKKHTDELNKMEKEIQDLKRKIQSGGKERDAEDSECLRVVLIGKTGSGKSTTGNTILGRDEFVSEACMDSVTNVCQKAISDVLGKRVAVVDTPGLFDTTLSNEEVTEEIVKCISLSAPGPHAFIIVLSVGRFTKEELETLNLIKMIFGSKAAEFSIVLFTRGDDLGNQSIEQYIAKCKNEQIKKLIRDCGDRFLAFNNKDKDSTQVSKLLEQVEMMVNSNKGQYFTNEMFQEAEMSIKKKMEQILKEREKEIEAEKEKLKAKHSIEMENMKKRLEEEKLKAEVEKRDMERKYSEKMEALQKEFEEKNETEKKKRELEDMERVKEEQKQMQEWQQRIDELEKENKKQRDGFEKQLKDRNEEDKKKEEKYKEEKEKLRAEQNCALEELRKRQDEELQRRTSEEQKRKQSEEFERSRWEEKIKEAEHGRKEIQEDLKQQQREWEEEKKRQMKQREEEDLCRKQRHEEELRAKQEEQERMRVKIEKEREEERQRREEEKQRWREAEKKEREEREREYKGKKQAMEAEMKEQYERLDRMRKEEWERRKREDDERREEEKQTLKKLRVEIERERQNEIQKREREERNRKEREEKERKEMEEEFDQKMKTMKKKYENEARQQAEEFNDFKDKKDKHIQKIQNEIEDSKQQYELLQRLLEFTKNQKDEEIKHLHAELKHYMRKCEEVRRMRSEVTIPHHSRSESWCVLL